MLSLVARSPNAKLLPKTKCQIAKCQWGGCLDGWMDHHWMPVPPPWLVQDDHTTQQGCVRIQESSVQASIYYCSHLCSLPELCGRNTEGTKGSLQPLTQMGQPFLFLQSRPRLGTAAFPFPCWLWLLPADAARIRSQTIDACRYTPCLVF